MTEFDNLAATKKKPGPLIAYIKVQQDFDKQLRETLTEASRLLNKRIENTNTLKDLQLRQMRRYLLEFHAELWEEMGYMILAGQKRAAAAAIDVVFDQIRPNAPRELLEVSQAMAERRVHNSISRLNGMSNYELSKTVWRSNSFNNRRIDRIIQQHLASGSDARTLASAVRELVDPDVRGGVSYAANRLARTEINNAFHATSVREYVEDDIVEYVEWNLSGSHKKPDICDDYAFHQHVDGQPGGYWLPKEVPAKPHPHCLCYITPVVSDEELIDW